MPTTSVPGAPTNVTASSGNGQATIGFTAPANNGGAAITSYSASCLPGPVTQTGTGSPLVVMGLSNGTMYSCAVRATNSAGQGAVSTAVNVTPAGPPDPPTDVSATGGNGSVTVSFTPPANNGGAAVVFYTATCSAGAPTTGAASPITVSGLTAGVAVTCSVIAHNAAGVSVPSASAMATPFGPPSVPLNFMVTPQDSSVMVTFSPPANDGGSMIDNYTVFCTSPGGTQLNSGLSSPIFVGGMTNGVAYACSMRARNAVGLF
ncbi:MAG: fibronectin type III domain-containing protein, partial [Betaproteobacteria bacterium]|nr:fibronectin type III domain-containing protein [Betaproteobacteria bacterium]